MTSTAAAIDAPTAARVAMYRLLAEALAFPTAGFHERVRVGAFRDDVREATSALACGSGLSEHVDALVTPDGYVDFQAEYIRLFDVGMVRPPCPLYGGEWGMTRRSTMEDALRFYRFFGMQVRDDARELPDHVTVQFEFMETMAYLERTARASGESELPLLRAQRDFLARHPGKWWPMLASKMRAQSASAFYAALTELTAAFLSAEGADLRTRAAAAVAD